MEPYIYREMDRLERDHWWFAGRRAVLEEAINRAALPPDAAILEAGCGTGGNLALLAGFGRVSALEPDPTARRMARAKAPRADIRPGSLPGDIPFPDAAFDLVAATDVLEHLEDDRAALKALATKLKPTGRLLITVPAHRFLWSRHDESHHHFRRYSKKRLRRALAQGGLRVDLCGYFNSWLFFPIALVRLSRLSLGDKDGIQGGLPKPALNRLLYRLMASEKKAACRGWLPVGVSILALARPA